MPGSRDLEEAMYDFPLSENPPTLSTGTPPLKLHPIITIMHEQELGKTVLNLAVLIAAANFFQKSPIQLHPKLLLITHILLCTGCVAIWNGITLRRTFPRAAPLVELAGMALVFFASAVQMASVSPKELLWFPVLFLGFLNLPTIIAALPRKPAGS